MPRPVAAGRTRTAGPPRARPARDLRALGGDTGVRRHAVDAAESVATPQEEPLGAYLQAQAAELLRSLRLHRESSGRAEQAADTAEAVHRLRRSTRRVAATLRTFRPLLDAQWAEHLRTELGWLSGTLALEYSYAARLDRLLAALHRLADGGGPSGPRAAGPSFSTTTPGGDVAARGGALPAGVARAGALLERRLTLSRTRAHSAALQALGSARFHALADEVALLASEPPVPRPARPARGVVHPPGGLLQPYADQARRRLLEAVDALPLARSEHPFHAEALARSLSAEADGDAPWLHVRLLLRLHRYGQEVLRGVPGSGTHGGPDALAAAGRELDRHRDAAEAANAAAAAARTPRIASTTAYALGVLHADQRHEAEAARFAFGRHWTAADGNDAVGRRGVR